MRRNIWEWVLMKEMIREMGSTEPTAIAPAGPDVAAAAKPRIKALFARWWSWG